MELTPRLSTVEALFRKLEREFVRAFHHPQATHKADHFYNFCITAHSMRDYFLERIGKASEADRKPFEHTWAQESVLVAVADIANCAKHFQLRQRGYGPPRAARTRKVGPGRTSLVDYFEDSNGRIITRRRSNVSTIVVTLEDGQRYELYVFMDAVLKYWKELLCFHSIRLRRQPWKVLHGRGT